MASEFTVEIVTPNKTFYNGSAEMIIVRTTEGDRGILKNHRPLVTGLATGTLRIKKDGNYKDAKISGGFMNVDKDKTVIVTESADWI
ncbi:ATP synthase F1 subunit epsilon [Romboutsia sedimentorum]|jgi:F-type H+-transporting ATPase subunit epsilon|uniref:ATP synthase epsilon chain n=1 Tax=Romboutsia sedimentorum TaxID=1368474 RepID=A0ABT7ED02_9FIRM|nr:ATP synthase F1 subunit epsilon [Romboutsia sedimentorum]MDK2564804.1 ATP synthase F1 subunit epsilon [Romboutsia sedimentorum]MDK2586897.1 ATP synthase F1 subunit epsilon [Romboutsia sedimentorum]